MLTQERLKEVLIYNPDTGEFIYKVDSQKKRAGEIAKGSIDINAGYRRILVAGKTYLDGRLAWLYMTGSFPPRGYEVDHRDTLKLNCRWDNLRLGTHAQNMQNRGTSTANTSGVKGVCWNKAKRKWQALFAHEGKNIFIGRYDSIEEAALAVKEKRNELCGNFANHGYSVVPNIENFL